MNFRVSVIIPVYNAEAYVQKAVKSALLQPEVKEVLVINDGSTDQTGKILEEISKESPKVKILYHPKRKNIGRSASRNLGIRAATSEFIAFLDADDYYLENRFKNDQRVFEEHPGIDGIYNAIGVHFYRKPTSQEETERLKLTTLKERVKPEDLFWYKSPKGEGGDFSGDGLTLKKNIFNKVDYFNEDLEVAEDSELWIKMTLSAKLFPGIIERPVSIRGVHNFNIFNKTQEDLYNKNYFLMYDSLLKWAILHKLKNEVIAFFKKKKLHYLLQLVQIDSRKIPPKEINLFLLKKYLKDRHLLRCLSYLMFTYFYKTTGKGYYFRNLYMRRINSS